MSPTYKILMIMLIAGLFLAGCTSSFIDQADQSSPGAVETGSEPKPAIPSETPVEETPAPVSGEVPTEIMEQIFADLVERTTIDQDDIQLVRAEAVVWNDGSLGCPEPGEYYIQMMISGYWVVLEVEGVAYDFRVSDMGNFRLCEGENMPPVDSSSTEIQNPLVTQAKADLASRLDIPTTEIELLNIEEVTWRDGSLGCPQPGMFYTQALVNGSLIQLVHDGMIFQYHSGRGGAPFLCDNPPKNLDEAITPGGAPPALSDQ